MMNMINVRVKFFAMCREAAGCEEAVIVLPASADAETFWQVIAEKFPRLKAYQNQSRLAVNMEYVAGAVQFQNGDEVCIIPPVSGG